MISKHKLLAVIATGAILATSFLGIQTFYTNDVASNQVSLRTPTQQNANFSGWGTKVLVN